MSLNNALDTDENVDLNKKQNDVLVTSTHEISVSTKAPPCTENDEVSNISMHSPTSGEMATNSSNNISAGSSNVQQQRRKTRRGKTRKRTKSGSKPYTTTQWKFQGPPPGGRERKRSIMLGEIRQSSDKPPLVPYNTNKFLMEDHMPTHPNNSNAIATPAGRTRDSSFSIDSEENYFYSLPEDEEEFLTKEFASVYEDARCERLEAMAKPQLIQEYLQLEANYEQLSRKYSMKFGKLEQKTVTKEERKIDEKVRELMSENLELKRQLEHISRLGIKIPMAVPSPRNMQMSSSSDDSESDSSSSSSTDDMDEDEEDRDASMNPVQNGYENHDDEEDLSSSNLTSSSPPTPLVINNNL